MAKLTKSVIINERINFESGEILEIKTEEKTVVSKTVVYNYTMMFENFCLLRMLTSRELMFLLAISIRIDYDCSEIDLSTALRVELGKSLDCNLSSVRNIICKLVKYKLLIKLDNGKHFLSPHLFFKGNLKCLRPAREKYSKLLNI
jgi:hypothetical protein